MGKEAHIYSLEMFYGILYIRYINILYTHNDNDDEFYANVNVFYEFDL